MDRKSEEEKVDKMIDISVGLACLQSRQQRDQHTPKVIFQIDPVTASSSVKSTIRFGRYLHWYMLYHGLQEVKSPGVVEFGWY